MVSRPQLLVRLLVACTEHTFRIATSSGSDLLFELDRVLLEQSAHVAKTLSQADPIAWAQNTLFARPADFSALLEDAVSQATAQLTSGNHSHADVTAAVKVAATIAIDGVTRQLSPEPGAPASSSEAPAGSGLVVSMISALTVAKAGSFFCDVCPPLPALYYGLVGVDFAWASRSAARFAFRASSFCVGRPDMACLCMLRHRSRRYFPRYLIAA